MKNNRKINFIGQRKSTVRDFNVFEMGFRKEFKNTRAWGGEWEDMEGNLDLRVSSRDMERGRVLRETCTDSLLWTSS